MGGRVGIANPSPKPKTDLETLLQMLNLALQLVQPFLRKSTTVSLLALATRRLAKPLNS